MVENPTPPTWRGNEVSAVLYIAGVGAGGTGGAGRGTGDGIPADAAE